MSKIWSDFIWRLRARLGLTQESLASLIGVSQRTISRWERGQDKPSMAHQCHLRDLGWQPSIMLLENLKLSVIHCPAPRALSKTPNLLLLAVSKQAIKKRPSIVDWIGRDLKPIACGVLVEIMEDKTLIQGIRKGEISCVRSITKSVLKTKEHKKIGKFETLTSYFMYEGAIYSDAISQPAAIDAKCGYQAIAMDEMIDPYKD